MVIQFLRFLNTDTRNLSAWLMKSVSILRFVEEVISSEFIGVNLSELSLMLFVKSIAAGDQKKFNPALLKGANN